MNCKKTIAGIAALSVLLSQSALVAMNASAEEAPEYKESTMKAYLYSYEDTVDIDCRFYNDMPNVPYIKLSDFYYYWAGENLEITNKKDGTYEVKVPIGEVGTIDINNETVYSNNFEYYFYPRFLLEGDDTSYATYVRSVASEGEDEYVPIEVTIDFSKYHIDLRGDEDSDEVWWPAPTLCDFYEFSLLQVSYLDHSLYFCGSIIGDFSRDKVIDSDEYAAALTEEFKKGRPKDMAEYNYNELCYAFDNQYGFPGRIYYNDLLAEKGLDGMLSEANDDTRKIKEMLLSENAYEYCAGFAMLNHYFWDGGHTGFSAIPYFDNDFKEESYKYKIPVDELENAIDHDADWEDFIVSSSLADEAREKMLETADTVERNKYSIYSTKGDTAVFSFDAFEAEGNNWLLYYYLEGEMPQDLITEFYNCVNKANNDPSIRNFIIDLGANGGGEVEIVEYMFSLLNNDNSLIVASGGKLLELNYNVDKNLDKSFDEKDAEIKFDLNFGVIESRASFSCGNLFPALAKDIGYMIVGETSGGGTCNVIFCTTADGLCYSISAGIKFVDSEGNDIDDGIKPHYELVKRDEEGNKDYSDVYNYANLSKLFKEYYKLEDAPEPITTTTTTTTTPVETTTTTTTTVEYTESEKQLCKWASKDYEKKNDSVVANAEITSSDDEKCEITLKDYEGNVLDVYTVDPATGEGTNSADEAVDLPQTGKNSPKTAAAAACAALLVISGGLAMYRSRRDEK